MLRIFTKPEGEKAKANNWMKITLFCHSGPSAAGEGFISLLICIVVLRGEKQISIWFYHAEFSRVSFFP